MYAIGVQVVEGWGISPVQGRNMVCDSLQQVQVQTGNVNASTLGNLAFFCSTASQWRSDHVSTRHISMIHADITFGEL